MSILVNKNIQLINRKKHSGKVEFYWREFLWNRIGVFISSFVALVRHIKELIEKIHRYRLCKYTVI